MHCRRFLPSLFPLSFFLVLLVIVRIPQSLGNPDGYRACRDPRFECGGISIGYPFSGDGIPPGCGHPGLQLYCENNIVTIEILDVIYQVLRIGEDNQTLQIARKDFMTDFCHPQFESSAFDSTLFNIFPGYTNVALFYDCTSAIPHSLGSYDCNGSHKNVSIIPPAFIREVCARNITVPISETSLRRIANSASLLEEALKTGFEVELNVSLKVDSKACQKCRDTGGTCGFDFQNHTNCYCLYDPGLSLKECPPPPPSQANTAEQAFANDGNYSSCSTRFRCGNIDTGYPFWGLERPEDCGYPGFWLNCSDDVPEITIMSVTYQVLDIESGTRNLRLARTDYSEDVCVQYLRNTTLTTGVFEYNSNTQNMTLYYGCRPLANIPTLPKGLSSQFQCEINETGNVGYYVTRNITESSFGELANLISTSLGSCNDSVTVPVLKSEVEVVEDNRTTESLIKALKVGFELRWFANDSFCDSCIGSGGQCGYNQDSREFLCYCSGGSYLSTCPQAEKKTDVSLITGLGIAGAVIAGILLGMGFLCLRQRRQKLAAQAKSRDLPTPPSSKGPPTSTTSLSQSIPSYPTSNYDLEKGSTYFGAHIFSYEELEEATDNFNPSKELGEGGFGTVYYGVLNDGRVVAVKRLYESNFKRAEQYMNEIEILTRIRHPNLVTLYGCTSRRSRELLLVYEYIPNGTVADHLHGKLSNSGLLTWPVRLSIAVETANALAYLHAAPIIHRDVKTNNILLDKNFHVKVADFGLSRLFPDNVTHVSTAPQGTPGYVDPEYYQCYQLTEKSDVYSFGVVLIELISSKQAVDTNRHRLDINLANMAVSRIQNHALHELVDPSLGFEDDYAVKTRMTGVAELAFRCLQQERDVRPSMEEVLETLRGIRDEELAVQKAEVVDIRSEAEVVDIRSDDVGLLKHIPPPLSPDSINDKWMQVRSM